MSVAPDRTWAELNRGLAYVLVTTAIRHVAALEASVLLLAEPALNPVWAWLVHGEQPGPWALTGGVVIVVLPTSGDAHRGDRYSFLPESLGALAPVEPPARFGTGSAPRRPCLVRVTTTVAVERDRSTTGAAS